MQVHFSLLAFCKAKQVNSCCSHIQSCPKKHTPTTKPRGRNFFYHRLVKSMLFLPHSSYRCWLQMFSSCWEAPDCSWESLRTSLCQSQLQEMLHTPHSPSLHSEISSPTALGSELQQPQLCTEPFISGFAQVGAQDKWRSAGVGSRGNDTRVSQGNDTSLRHWRRK